MSKKLVQQAVVKTNTTKDSVCSVHVKPITFDDLWDNYVKGHPYVDKNGDVPSGFDNQCAIRMSATLHKVGVEMKSFMPANVTVKPGNSFGRVMLDGKYAAVKADQMGSWLSKQPFCGLPQKPENITGKDWESKVKGRRGIIMFDGYWTRPGESKATGGHIDLWNGTRLTVNGFFDGIATWSRRFGWNSFLPGTGVGWSDLGNSTTILFWEIK